MTAWTNVVNWATATPMPLAQQLADKFTQATGIKVTLVRNGDDALLRRLVEGPQGRTAGAQDLFWGLLNAKEFVFNH